MKLNPLGTFDILEHEDKIISPIDKEVTAFMLDLKGKKYLANQFCMYEISQFNPNDFYRYNGDKEVGEVDDDYFKKNDCCRENKCVFYFPCCEASYDGCMYGASAEDKESERECKK